MTCMVTIPQFRFTLRASLSLTWTRTLRCQKYSPTVGWLSGTTATSCTRYCQIRSDGQIMYHLTLQASCEIKLQWELEIWHVHICKYSLSLLLLSPSLSLLHSFFLSLSPPSQVDPLVSLMMVEKVPDSTYDMVGGLDKQIKEIKEVGVADSSNLFSYHK